MIMVKTSSSSHYCGRNWHFDVSAEVATAPESLRQKDRNGLRLWKVDMTKVYPTEDVNLMFG